MVILSAKNLSKVYGTDVILEQVSFHINEGDRIGVIGKNGAGKSTLMNLLCGELTSDGGEFFVSQNIRIGYLKQRENFQSEGTVMEEVMKIFSPLLSMEKEMEAVTAALDKNPGDEILVRRLTDLHETFYSQGGDTFRSEIRGILNSMAFGPEFYDKKISSLSGGERTRLALAALLLEKPDLLMLDEPTNHLDIGTLKWLEQYLSGYKGTIMVVSHDRYFLNQLVNRIFEVENHHLRCYDGNYDKFAEEKRVRRESELRAYQNQQKEIRRQEDMIRRFKERGTEKLAKRAQSREKRLEAMDRLERPESEGGRMKIHFRQNFQSGYDVLRGEGLAKGFGYGSERRELFHGVDFDIKRGERICIVGPNGVGKTTLLRMMLGEIDPSDGLLKAGHNVTFGYYDQGQLLLHDNYTVLEELKESYRLYSDTEMRAILGRFLFQGEDVFLKVGSLSGGEKARLSLLKMMLSGANTLLLDEPTNHLDIESKEVFEDALLEFPGTSVIVSHDRYFLQKIPTRILELETDGLKEYLGGYDYYVEKKAQIASGKKYMEELKAGEGNGQSKKADPDDFSAAGARTLSEKELRQLNKQKEAEERRRRRLAQELEERINSCEQDIMNLEEQIADPQNALDYQLLEKLAQELEEKKKELDRVYAEWAEVEV